MGDYSRCPHDFFVGYCDICSPGWEDELNKCELHDRIYQRGIVEGIRRARELKKEESK